MGRSNQLDFQTAARKMTRLKSLNPINGSGQNYYVDQCVSVLAGEADNPSGVFQASDLEWNKMVDENNEINRRLNRTSKVYADLEAKHEAEGCNPNCTGTEHRLDDRLAVNHPDPVPVISKHIPECNKFCDPQTGVHHLH